MCFSVEVQKELRRTAERFNAQVSMTEIQNFYSLQEKGEDREWVK